MNEKTKTYVQFIKENHKDFPDGKLTGAACAACLKISQGRVSQLLKEIKEGNKVILDALENVETNQEAAASTAEA